MLHQVVPAPLIQSAQDATLFIGVLLLLLAYPAAQGHRRMAQLFMALTALAALTHLLKGLDVEEAALNLVAFGALWRGWRLACSSPCASTASSKG